MRAVFALLRTPVATEPKRSHERRAIPAGNVFGGRKLAFPPPWRSVFPRNRLFRFAFAVHPCLRELSGECERGTPWACATRLSFPICATHPASDNIRRMFLTEATVLHYLLDKRFA